MRQGNIFGTREAPAATPKPKKRRKKSTRNALVDVPRGLAFADETLSRPPHKPHIVRVPPVGDLVARVVLPLDLCKPTNRTRGAQHWQHAKTRNDVYRHLGGQLRIQEAPLPGRPMLRCIRFSCVEPDKYNDGFKVPVDALCVPRGRSKRGFGFLRDDAPAYVDLHQWWEYAPRRQGFGLIEIYTGAP